MKVFRNILKSFSQRSDEWSALAHRMTQSDRLNLLADSRMIVLSDNDFEILCKTNQIEYGCFNIKKPEYIKWIKAVRDILPEHLYNEKIGIEHKKLLEFYVSYSLLEINKSDVVLDVAGHQSLYLRIVRKLVPIKRAILHDININKEDYVDIETIESDVSHIAVPNSFVSKIAVHHSFEHFRGNSDIEAMTEFQRILADDGICAIVPIMLSTKYWEIFNTDTVTPYDSDAEVINDKYSTFPGWGRGEGFARAYSPDAFIKRIIQNVNRSLFDIKAYKITMDGRSVPNMDVNIGTHINYPMRVLHLRRV